MDLGTSRVSRVSDRLRPLWDFDDLDGSEARLRAALGEERTDAGRAEVLTQLARVLGLRGDFGAGEQLVDEAADIAGNEGIAAARVDLERGRLRRSSGDRQAALPLFESAFEKAARAEQWFVAADAAHMAALASPGREGFVEWTQRGIELGQEHEVASYWAGPLFNNLGWEHYEAGEHDQALDAFDRALRARELEPDKEEPIALARYAVGKALRALGRSQEAVPLLEQATTWAADRGTPDGWYHEELALEYAEVGRLEEAQEQATLAIPLLETADASLPDDAERSSRLRELAGA
jgi:tetratricopeptide (TPR) repeat protein